MLAIFFGGVGNPSTVQTNHVFVGWLSAQGWVWTFSKSLSLFGLSFLIWKMGTLAVESAGLPAVDGLLAEAHLHSRSLPGAGTQVAATQAACMSSR